MDDKHINKTNSKWVIWGFILSVLACAVSMVIFIYVMRN
ncbi:hypothetical protein DES34_101459 [Brevibacillus brevis]|jgi:hypothetical protein|uniref:Uncharacterized protein n=1 Tax=Brevibacillus brevis (strain 47 / JCM 6285 / NBRC 100599) TaxID=358681 RepID=C0ZE60_BREBN|nr:hypothetical protein PMI05_05885 [Brevibacillus sp. BC25]RED35797.1 hypothetical protein DES34_101459 [Brevibacillus brevis]TQK53479.1 hypothetical protein FB479_110119 [Brevibacillus sp. AG162]BAH44069.1 hypothetical protein BBR47_30920 [Brevibacillus brevis NBRC 100599]VEF89094.1 Uncharacterised protein [Brevibacillus brevis]